MKKIFLIILTIAIIGSVIFLVTENSQLGKTRQDDQLNKIITYRLNDIFGLRFKIEKAEVVNGNELLLSNISIFGTYSGATPLLFIKSLRGYYNEEKLELENLYHIKDATLEGITLPKLEVGDITEDLERKLNKNFRGIFKEWDNTIQIEKILSQIKSLSVNTKVTNLKHSNRAFDKNEEIRRNLQSALIAKLSDSQIQEYLQDLERGVRFYEEASVPNVTTDISPFLKNNRSALVTKAEFYELEMLEFLVKRKMEDLTKGVLDNLRQLHKAQFFSPESSEKFPHLLFETVRIREGIVGSDKSMVGHINHLSSDSKDMEKIRFVVQGDFEKYKINGIDIRIGIYKDNNKVITYNASILELPLRHYVFYEDDERALMLDSVKGRLDFKGIVQTSQIAGDIAYTVDEIDIFRSPLLDKVINHTFNDYLSQEQKNFIIIFRQEPRQEPSINFEFGNKYLETQEPSLKMFEAYFEDLKSAYFTNLEVSDEGVTQSLSDLASGYEQAKELIGKLKEQLEVRKKN